MKRAAKTNSQHAPVPATDCSSADCACRAQGTALGRREFLKLSGLAATGLALSKLLVMAGPFTREDFNSLVPAEKKLDPAWVASLFARGAPEILRGAELKYVGMPVGGICAGQIYLGGEGKLWHWDLFNRTGNTGESGPHYAAPLTPASPVEQGFCLRLGKKNIALDRTGFSDVSFRGEYPIGQVEYRDPAVPVAVKLEAFSPFIPLNTDDSSLPATVMRFTVKNDSRETVETELFGWLENAVCLSNRQLDGKRQNRIAHGKGHTFLDCFVAKAVADDAAASKEADIIFEDWNKETYEGWTVEGAAFGAGPVRKSAIPVYQGDVGGNAARVVNSHATAPGGDIGSKDSATGKLTSKKFTVERNFINVWIGGGANKDVTCLNVVVDGKAVRSATGRNDNKMTLQSLGVRDLKGKEAVIQIVDGSTGAWGNIGVGRITFSDKRAAAEELEKLPDYGTMGLALLGEAADRTVADAGGSGLGDKAGREASVPLADKLVGAVGRKLTIAPGKSAVATFVLTWHFPNLAIGGVREGGRYYAVKFADAAAVAGYIAENFERLAAATRLWRDTWYDSTLPYWFLDRTQANTSTLATSTCSRFKGGRFWAWEGVGCCPGTCGHVWHYAHAMGRQFPELERIVRERVDFGLALQPDGAIHFRGEVNDFPAIDAQAGAILRALREHQMSADDAFLRRVWPGVKRAADWLITKDGDGDGLIESNQHNTLDADWFGPVAWLSGLYLAALSAAATLADEMGDAGYAEKCRTILARGQKKLVNELFDGNYFINKVDPKHLTSINSGTGCEIDQAMGQSWAFQVGLPRVLPEKETRTALQALWKYNFSPDVGPYRNHYKEGRWYAMAGEAGLLMCSFPRQGWDFNEAKGQSNSGFAGYFNECMTGFEYQVAGHMVWEGMVQEGLAITRAVHDRYQASKRNPWNEVECGDHYARAMASYGVFLAACGYEYHGPKAHIGFAPRLTSEDFRCAFTAAEGWGSFSQKIADGKLNASLAVKWGQLRLRTVSLGVALKPASVTVRAGGKTIPATLVYQDGKTTISLADAVTLSADQSLELALN